jgi:hypothetical protein
LDWGRDPSGEVAGEWWGAAHGGCASGDRRGVGVMRAMLVATWGDRVAVSGLGGSEEKWDRRLGEAARHSVGHWATTGATVGVLGLGYMGPVASNVFMGFISAGTLQ